MVDQKESETRGGERVAGPEGTPVIEVSRKESENLEVESWMEKIEKRFARIPKGQPGVQDDTVIVAQPQSTQPPVQLPVNQQQLKVGKKVPVESGLAWLVTWALRRIKMLTRLGRKVKLQDIPEVKNDK